MAQDKITLFRQALAHAGLTGTLDSPDDSGVEAAQCRLHYDTVRDTVFSASYWPELKAAKRLGVVTERDPDIAWVSTDPFPGWTYAYALPIDCIRPRFLADFSRFELSASSSNVTVLNTDRDTPILTYTRRVEELNLWSTDLFDSVVFGLAARIVMPLTRKASRMKDLTAIANAKIMANRVAVANNEDNRIDTLASWHVARGYSGGLQQDRYFYPFGGLLEGMGVALD